MADVWEGRQERTSGLSAWTQVGLGMGIVLLEHVFFGGLIGGGSYLLEAYGGVTEAVGFFFIWLFGIGLSQLGYVLPTFLVALAVRRNIAAGIALGALITFLLNGACFGVLCGSMGM